MLSSSDERDLASLRWRWSGAYLFTICGGRWVAMSQQLPVRVLTAATPDELRVLVRQDYLTYRSGI